MNQRKKETAELYKHYFLLILHCRLNFVICVPFFIDCRHIKRNWIIWRIGPLELGGRNWGATGPPDFPRFCKMVNWPNDQATDGLLVLALPEFCTFCQLWKETSELFFYDRQIDNKFSIYVSIFWMWLEWMVFSLLWASVTFLMFVFFFGCYLSPLCWLRGL